MTNFYRLIIHKEIEIISLEDKKFYLENIGSFAEPGVDGHHALLSHRRCQQELAQVFAEDLDGFDIGLFLGLAQDFTGDGRVQ